MTRVYVQLEGGVSAYLTDDYGGVKLIPSSAQDMIGMGSVPDRPKIVVQTKGLSSEQKRLLTDAVLRGRVDWKFERE